MSARQKYDPDAVLTRDMLVEARGGNQYAGELVLTHRDGNLIVLGTITEFITGWRAHTPFGVEKMGKSKPALRRWLWGQRWARGAP